MPNVSCLTPSVALHSKQCVHVEPLFDFLLPVVDEARAPPPKRMRNAGSSAGAGSSSSSGGGASRGSSGSATKRKTPAAAPAAPGADAASGISGDNAMAEGAATGRSLSLGYRPLAGADDDYDDD